jgi:hypothetical protein
MKYFILSVNPNNYKIPKVTAEFKMNVVNVGVTELMGQQRKEVPS